MSHKPILKITGKDFKEICKTDDCLNTKIIISGILNDLLDPKRNLDLSDEAINQLIDCMCGGLTYEKFKSESKYYIDIKSRLIIIFKLNYFS